MSRFLAVALLSLFPLAACGGGGSSASLPQTATVPTDSLTEAQSDAQYQVREPLWSSNPDLLYIGNQGNNSITVYKHDAKGNTAPLKVIAGSKTGLYVPSQLSEDAQGNLYVANYFSILVFAHGANGNVAPIRKITGPLLQYGGVRAVTVDRVTGKIFMFVIDSPSGGGITRFLRYPPNATGNAVPFAISPAAFNPAVQLANDSTGKNIIEAYSERCCEADEVGTVTVAKQFPNNQLPNEPYGFTFFQTSGVADDPTSKTYLVSGYDGIKSGLFRFAETTTGHGAYTYDTSAVNYFQPALVSVVIETCGGQLAVAPGPTPYTYVVHNCPGDAYPAVKVYANSANGNAIPIRTLTGPATLMNGPSGIYEGE